MAGLSPRNREDPSTPIMLKFLSKSFSKIAENIQPIDGEDALVSEIEKYSVDSDLLRIGQFSSLCRILDCSWKNDRGTRLAENMMYFLISH